jgi:pimeloyl-ACP methyl ester carboxylesterase
MSSMSKLSLPRKSEDGVAYYEASPDTSKERVTYLLLHGLGNSLDYWAGIAPELSDIGHVVAIDMPGFGKSLAPLDGFSLEHVSRTMSNFCITRDLDRCIIVAHSLGGFVGLRLAALEPERFRRVILVNGTLSRAAQMAQNPRGVLRDPSLAFYVGAQFLGGALPIRGGMAKIISRSRIIRDLTLWPYVENPGDIDPELLAAALSDNGGVTVLKVLTHFRHINYSDLMKDVPHPVDLVWGANDHLINGQDVECAKTYMNVERELQIPGCGHWPMIEKPSTLSEFILAWD